MKRTVTRNVENNIIYVEPNYVNSTEQYDTRGLNTYEFAPPLEDYSIFVNLEVEVKGRNVQSSKSSTNKKLILSFITSTDGTSAVNFMQGTKIPIGENGATINSLTTNYTDIHLRDLKQKSPSTELFGIESIDIAYNSYMVPEVTIEFVDVRGVALFAQKELYESNKYIDNAIDGNKSGDIANTFFQCFFTFPYPKFTLLVKGFYGQPVSYELTCADFRARFDSKSGNFACTAKFVGYHFSFLNDVMMNGIVAAPYSDFIGAAYWEKREFKLQGNSNNLVDLPKIGWLLSKMKEIESMANRIAQSDPVSQEKTALDQKTDRYNEIENYYNAFVREINKCIKSEKEEHGEQIVGREHTDNGFLKSLILMSPTDNQETFEDYTDVDNQMEERYEALVEALEKYNEEFSSEKLPIPNQFYDSNPTQRIWNKSNSETKAHMTGDANDDIKSQNPILYNKFKIYVENGNLRGKNPLLDYKQVYYYYDNKFAETLEGYKKENTKALQEVEDKIESMVDTAISEALGFHPTVENMTKIVMAHFETFAWMIFETARIICNEKPKRTIASLKVSDVRDISDVNNRSKTSDIEVPPFPKVTSEVRRENSTIREESWVGDYEGDFREKDLVHGIINGINQVSKDIMKYEDPDAAGNAGGSTTESTTKMRFPLSPLDLIAKSKPYLYGGFDQNDVSSIMGLVGLRALQILGTNNFSDWGEHADALGKAEAYNFLSDNNISKELGQKLSNLSGSDVMEMMKGSSSGSIKKPGDGSSPWPWRNDPNNSGGIIDETGKLIICKVKDNSFAVPYQNLGWEKIKNEVVNSPDGVKALWSNDYVNSKSFENVTKDNCFTFDTNVNRFSSIVESQLKEVDNIDYYQEKLLKECKYDKDRYKDFLTSKAEYTIAYIIENAATMIPSDGSCMLPTSKNYFSDKSFKGGYDMDDFHKYNPGAGGDGWLDKDNKDVKRKGDDGYENYLEHFNYRDFAFTEFPGLERDLEPFVKYRDPAVSIFSQLLYYREDDTRVRAMLFLASIGYVVDYKDIINDFICDESKTMAVIPLPAVLFIGALLWSETTEGKKAIKFCNTGYYEDEIKTLLNKLRPDVQRKFIKTFEKWVNEGIETDSLLRSFSDIRSGMELKLIHKDSTGKLRTYEEFFNLLDEMEDKTWIGGTNDWVKEYDQSYEKISDFLKGELSDEFFRNYITIDEDVYGNTSDGTRGMRLGIRDGGTSSIHASNLALAGCVFSKNTKFFHGDAKSGIYVPFGTLEQFFNGFLDIVKEQKYDDDTNVSQQISQALDPKDSNTDIKIGIYRYCKMLYDKWIAGISEEEFNTSWTVKSFFEGPKKYFYFIDAYYNVTDFIPMNIGNFCDQIVSCYRSEQYSLLSFLSSIYQHNKFNFLCVQNFIDLSKKENMENMFDTVPYTQTWDIKRHPNFIVMYPYESSSHLADVDESEYENDGFMINQPNSVDNLWPEPLTSKNANAGIRYNIPAFGVSYGKLYQSYFQDIDVSMDNPTVTEQSIKAQFAIACQNNEGEQTGDRSKLYTYGQDLYSIYSNNSYTCNVTMMGCAWVQPLMYFVLNNVPMFRGTYLIEKVTHHIEPGNMVTKFMGVRMSNVCTRIAREEAVRARNDQEGTGESNSESPDVRERLASVDNNCPYKEYPLSGNETALENLEGLQLASSEMENARLTVAAFVSMGYTDVAGAAVAGNIRQETHYVPKYVNKMVKAKHNPGMKGGLCQWQGPRLTRLVTGDMETTSIIQTEQPMPCFGKQLMFIDKECREVSAYKASLNALRGATSDDKLESVTEKFRANYEGGSEAEKRKQYAKEILEEYRKNPIKDKNTTISKNGDEHISELATGFLNAINKTAAASSSNVNIGVDAKKSSGDTLYLTNGNNTENFANVLDMIINAYHTKVDSVNWIIPGDGKNYNSVPAAYLVHVNENSSVTNIKVTSENNPDVMLSEKIPVSKGNDVSGIHDSFCKALIKKYGSNTPQLKSDTNEQLDDYDALFDTNEGRYKITDCNKAMEEAGISTGGETGGQENESGYIGEWNVGLFVQKLHYWSAHHCEEEYKRSGGKKGKRDKPGGSCHLCTGAINRALRDSGLGMKYWGGEPWIVYDKMKASGSEFVEITGGTSSNKSEFPFGQNPQKGDVCVMWKSGRKTPRHSCSFDGSDWYSDFKQGGVCNVYKNRDAFNLEWHYFRHR